MSARTRVPPSWADGWAVWDVVLVALAVLALVSVGLAATVFTVKGSPRDGQAPAGGDARPTTEPDVDDVLCFKPRFRDHPGC